MKAIVADDSSVILHKVCRLLDQMGFETVAVRNGIAAYEAFLLDSADLIVTDLIMPEYDGIELTRRIRELDRYVPIAVLTSAADLRYVERAEAAGASAYLLKPIDDEQFQHRIEALLDSVSEKALK